MGNATTAHCRYNSLDISRSLDESSQWMLLLPLILCLVWEFMAIYACFFSSERVCDVFSVVPSNMVGMECCCCCFNILFTVTNSQAKMTWSANQHDMIYTGDDKTTLANIHANLNVSWSEHAKIFECVCFSLKFMPLLFRIRDAARASCWCTFVSSVVVRQWHFYSCDSCWMTKYAQLCV